MILKLKFIISLYKMSYLQFNPYSKPKYTQNQISNAKKVLFNLEDRDLLLALNTHQVFYYAADENFWEQRSIKNDLNNKPSDITWKKYYLSQFI
jgi:hypothetical protein